MHDFPISMRRKADRLDNAYVVSFIKTLKSYAVYLWEQGVLAMVLQC